MGRAIDC